MSFGELQHGRLLFNLGFPTCEKRLNWNESMEIGGGTPARLLAWRGVPTIKRKKKEEENKCCRCKFQLQVPQWISFLRQQLDTNRSSPAQSSLLSIREEEEEEEEEEENIHRKDSSVHFSFKLRNPHPESGVVIQFQFKRFEKIRFLSEYIYLFIYLLKLSFVRCVVFLNFTHFHNRRTEIESEFDLMQSGLMQFNPMWRERWIYSCCSRCCESNNGKRSWNPPE